MANVKFSGLTAIPGSDIVVASDIIPIVDTSAGSSGSKKITVEELFKSLDLTPHVKDLVVGKATNTGIKIDTDSPEFGYRDITADINVRGSGGSDPTWATFRSPISAYVFSATVEKECWLVYHVPHDYVPGTDVYFHAHWANAAAVPDTGNIVWGFDYSYAKGYDQEAFPAATTITVTQACPATRYQHNIAETTAVTIAGLEVDGLILCRVYRKAADAADTLTDTAFLFTADIHYQSTNLATKQRNGPAFYT